MNSFINYRALSQVQALLLRSLCLAIFSTAMLGSAFAASSSQGSCSRGKAFSWVDVFAENPFEGNQLKVVLDAACLSDEQMQSIAAEFGGSETIFVLSKKPVEGEWPVRIFLPNGELEFGGHPTLGAAQVLRKRDPNNQPDQIVINFVNGVGSIPVEFIETAPGKETPFLTTGGATFGQTFSSQQIQDLAVAIGLDPSFIIDSPNSPVQTVNTGTPFVMVPVEGSPEALAALRSINFSDSAVIAGIDDFLANEATDAIALYIFTSETIGAVDFYARATAGTLQNEDAATGSAASNLAAYAALYQLLGSENAEITIEQGFELNRPSLLFANASAVDGSVDSTVIGGNVIDFATGRISVQCEGCDDQMMNTPKQCFKDMRKQCVADRRERCQYKSWYDRKICIQRIKSKCTKKAVKMCKPAGGY